LRRASSEKAARELKRVRVRHRTRFLAGLAVASLVGVFGVEFARIWRLGSMQAGRSEEPSEDGLVSHGRLARDQFVFVIREGMRVTSTHENAVFSMLGSFALTFGTARTITFVIRERGAAGPFKDLHVGDRHIHHFVPGGLLTFISGGVSIASRGKKIDRWLAIPFGAGVALVLDEAALLLELEDVYWAEEGLLSIDIAFGAICVLSSLAYLVRLVRRGEARAREEDWLTAARAFDDLMLLPGASRSER
jgi:hypothetical protein